MSNQESLVAKDSLERGFEKPNIEFERSLEKINNRLLDELRENFSQLEYHNVEHSIGVGEKAVSFLESAPEESITERDKILARTIGYGHDIIQTYEDPWPEAFSGIGKRRARKTGLIEQESADYIAKLLREQGVELTPDEESILQEAIRATVPGFSPELKTVIQPHINANSHPVVWSVAAADLASAGTDPEHFLKDGDNVFREDRMLPLLETLDDETLQKLYDEVIGWTASQVTYTEGQKQYWNREEVPDFIKDRLTEFDKTIELCRARLKRRQDLYDDSLSILENTQALLDDMQFKRYLT